MSREKILVIDNDRRTRRLLRSGLTKQGYAVTDARNGAEAMRKLRRELFDLIILDRNVDNVGLLDSYRQIGSASDIGVATPTIRMREAGLDGAVNASGDGAPKAFSMRQLLKRIRTTLRRRPVQSPQEDPIVVSFDEIEMNFGARQVSVSGQDIRLTPKEFLLLRYLVTNPNRAIPHVNLLKAVWGPDYGREVEYLRVFINRIRKKIETNPAKPRYILTEPWFGYRFHLPQKT